MTDKRHTVQVRCCWCGKNMGTLEMSEHTIKRVPVEQALCSDCQANADLKRKAGGC